MNTLSALAVLALIFAVELVFGGLNGVFGLF
jgi:hypothetical protein